MYSKQLVTWDERDPDSTRELYLQLDLLQRETEEIIRRLQARIEALEAK